MRSVRSQLIGRLLMGGALLLASAGMVLHWKVGHALTDQLDSALGLTIQSLAALTEQENGRSSLQFTKEDLPQFQLVNGSDIFLLLDADGSEIERSPSLGPAALTAQAGRAGAPIFFDAKLSDGRNLRCAGVRFVPHEEEDEGKEKKKKHQAARTEAVLIVGRNRGALDQTLATLDAGLLAVGIGALAALAALVHWSVKSALAPLDALGESVSSVDAASLTTRFPAADLPLELQPITNHLNALLGRLDGAFARERRFTATAAHELRTPLAELRALAEVNLSMPATPAENVESWRDALSSTRRMESLAFSLLELARAEDPSRVIHHETVRLSEAVVQAWKGWEICAAQRKISLVNQVPPDLIVESDPDLLGVILNNLVGNAAEHAPENASLRIGAESGNQVTLIFANPAGNLEEADLPHLFERFWRKDVSRSDARHHGLGLSLAADFARLLGASLTAHLSRQGDLEFVLRLPAE